MSQIYVVVHVPVFCPFSIMMWACREELPAKKTNKTPNKPCHLQCPSVRAKYAHWDRRMTSDTLISSLSLQDSTRHWKRNQQNKHLPFNCIHYFLFLLATVSIFFLQPFFLFVIYGFWLYLPWFNHCQHAHGQLFFAVIYGSVRIPSWLMHLTSLFSYLYALSIGGLLLMCAINCEFLWEMDNFTKMWCPCLAKTLRLP